MSDAPERIWMMPQMAKRPQFFKAIYDGCGEIEYIRADSVPGWQPIETAPRDGTKVVLARANWSEYPIAQWMKYPGNPVLDGNGNDCNMYGWGHDSAGFTVGYEDYWLGWDEDQMPTHWMPLPEPPQN